jgi:UDP-N-acetylglucosamine--N-acetylmuramyl-(pentapeptide) pyrophosphoryl-undecaprenol N-acetylglucosamine transferase
MLVAQCQIVHLTGRGRGVAVPDVGPRYRQIEFLVEEMPHLLAGADLVITRAGMGTLSELSALHKASIVIPLPGSHQEANARAFGDAGAAVHVDQSSLTGESLAAVVIGLLTDVARMTKLGAAIGHFMPAGAAGSIASDVLALARSRR